MRFVFKTDYRQDIQLFRHGGQLFWYTALLLLAIVAPLGLGTYGISQLTFVLIYGIAGLGMMMLTGYTGLVSIGHAAFLGIGAYVQALLVASGWPFPLAIAAAGLLAGASGVIVGLPALRIRGIYLTIATLAFGFIVEEGLARWESLTGGNAGLPVPAATLFGRSVQAPTSYYYVVLFLTILTTLAVLNLLRSSTGRAFIAIRDSEISAQSMGISLAGYKTLSFALSAAIVGVAGALSSHVLRFISPEQFGIVQSIDLLLLVVIGGLGSVHGAFLGAIFLVTMPQMITLAKDSLPTAIGQAAGLQLAVYGAILVAFVVYEPLGLYRYWVKLRTWMEMFPIYRRGTFKRQKSFQKSERQK